MVKILFSADGLNYTFSKNIPSRLIRKRSRNSRPEMIPSKDSPKDVPFGHLSVLKWNWEQINFLLSSLLIV